MLSFKFMYEEFISARLQLCFTCSSVHASQSEQVHVVFWKAWAVLPQNYK